MLDIAPFHRTSHGTRKAKTMKNRRFRERTIDGEIATPACVDTAIDCFRNILVAMRRTRRVRSRAFEEIEEDDIAFGAFQMIDARLVPELYEDSEKLWIHVWRVLDHSVRLSRPARHPVNPVRANLLLVAAMIGFSPVESEILQFLVVQRLVKTLESLTSAFGALSLSGAAEILSAALLLPRDEVLLALMPKGRLLASGLVSVDEDPEPFSQKVVVKRSLVDLLLMPGLDRVRFLDHFLPLAPADNAARHGLFSFRFRNNDR